jgi:hypothetical protein
MSTLVGNLVPGEMFVLEFKNGACGFCENDFNGDCQEYDDKTECCYFDLKDEEGVGELLVYDPPERTCKTCRHWKRLFILMPDDRYFLLEDIKKNVSGDFSCKQSKIGSCTCDKFIYGENEDTPEDGLSYTDSEEYSAQLRTGENFGCIHWEERP